MFFLVTVYVTIAMILVVAHFYILKNWLSQQQKAQALNSDGKPVPRRLRWLLGMDTWELRVHSICTNLLLFVFIIALPLVVKMSNEPAGSPRWVKLGLFAFIIVLVTRAVPRLTIGVIRYFDRDTK